MAQLKLLNYKEDLSLIKEHFNLLDKESLTQRFNYYVNQHHLENYFKGFNKNDIYVGVIVKNNNNNSNNDSNILAGFLHLAILKNNDETFNGEIGISVLKKYQGNQLASAMMVMALFEVQQKILEEEFKINDITMHCDFNNKASIALGKKFGLHVIIEATNSQQEIKQTKKFKNKEI